ILSSSKQRGQRRDRDNEASASRSSGLAVVLAVVVGVSVFKWRLIGAETDLSVQVAADRIEHKLAIALGAEIKRAAMEALVHRVLVVAVVQAFENVLNFREVIAVVVALVELNRLDGGVNFQFHDVTHFFLGI